MLTLIEFSTLVFLIFIAAVALIKRRYSYWKNLGIPYLEPTFPYGNIKGLGKDFVHFELHRKIYEDFKQKAAPFVGLFYYFEPVVFCTNLEFVKNVFMRDSAYFIDRGTYYNERDNPISAHLFNIDNPKWKPLRAKLTPTFTSGKIKAMFHTVCDVGERFVRKLEEEVKTAAGGELEMREYAARFTTDTIGSVGFGIEINSLDNPTTEFRVMGTKVFEHPKFSARVFQLIVSFKELARKLGVSAIHRDVEEFFTRIVSETIEHREANHIARADFMNLMIQLKNHGKLEGEITSIGRLSLEEIVAQCFIFFLAGYETSSNAISHALFELAHNQCLQDKARENVRQVLAKHGGKLTYEALMEMEYVEMCLNETLRKHPPVATLARYCSKDYKVENTNCTIKKGQLVLIPAYAIHYDSDIFPNPEVFDPERFSQAEMSKRPAVAFMPFGHGARNCIGLRFGMIQAKIGIVLLLNSFRFEPSEGASYPLKYKKNMVFMRNPVDGVYLRVSKL